MLPSRNSPAARLLLVAVLLGAWVVWLRAPGFGVPLWNVDEAIHAAAARTLLDGGVMYRDAIDQRTPLTYYAFAGVFAVFGSNNLPAVRGLIALLIAGVALGLFVLGRRTRNTAAGATAALAFAAFANRLLFPGDAYAADTEWFVIAFTTAAAVTFLRSPELPSFRRSAAVGALIAGAFLSKQPGAADLLPAAGTIVWAGLTGGAPRRVVLRALAGVAAGFAVPVLLVFLMFAALGASHDFVLYAWTYNLRYYAPEIPWDQRVWSVLPLATALAKTYPLLLVLAAAGAVTVALRVVQFRPWSELAARRTADTYLLLWCVSSLIGAGSSGRGFDHYFIQCLPPLAWLCAWIPGWLGENKTSPDAPDRPRWRRAAAVAVLVVVFANVVWTPLAARKVAPPPPDPALRLSAYIRSHSAPGDRIFVWGYNPDIYLYANRRPASRFLYCSFQTGLIPWTNLDPAKDTSYAVVPGTMEQLLRDLERTRPTYIVDCGVGPHRRFQKYPLSRFPELLRFVESHCVELEPDVFPGQGFRLFRWQTGPDGTTAHRDGSAAHGAPELSGPPAIGSGPAAFRLGVSAPHRDAVRLALHRDGAESAVVDCSGFDNLTAVSWVRLPDGDTAPHRFEAVATWSDGTETVSVPLELKVSTLDRSPKAQAEFALPEERGTLRAEGVRALFNPRVDLTDGQRVFALHAPSLLTYELPPHATAVRGSFGIPPGAYAAGNKAPTDGAEFVVRLVPPGGGARVLLDRLLQPARNPSDRPAQSFRVELPAGTAGSRLEFEITPGPNGNASSDWTFWSDVVLETSG